MIGIYKSMMLANANIFYYRMLENVGIKLLRNADIFSKILVFPIAIVDTYVYNIVSP